MAAAGGAAGGVRARFFDGSRLLEVGVGASVRSQRARPPAASSTRQSEPSAAARTVPC